MDTDNSVEKAWGGVGARRKGVKKGGNWGASVILSIKIKKKRIQTKKQVKLVAQCNNRF